jgi:hypothetical protein
MEENEARKNYHLENIQLTQERLANRKLEREIVRK